LGASATIFNLSNTPITASLSISYAVSYVVKALECLPKRR
jgi:hypothetical protein